MPGSNLRPTVRPDVWHRVLPPVTATIRCGGEQHRVSWRAGRLVLHDHDLRAELALRALGGRSSPCLDVVEAARRYLRRLGPSGLWAAEGDPTGLVLPPVPGSPAATPDVDDERRLDALRALPAPFRRRLALAMFVAASRDAAGSGSWQQPPFGRVLTSLIGPAVARSLEDAAGRPGAAANVDVRWTAIGPDERPALEGEVGPAGGWAHVRLSPTWVPLVWARSLAHVGGRLVLGVAGSAQSAQAGDERPGPGRLLLHTASWVPGPAGGPADRWRAGPTTTIGLPAPPS